ncbi:30S ribosomal protein S18 [Candidatus Hodgkinia cicadicola]|nr:30S ribosomal protein S18 [Candidatus Hodgkinia cicadicola]
MAWYLHFIIDTQFVLTTCFIKRVKQSIKFEGIITRWHLFCICLDKTYKELIVCDINISMGCQLFKKINKKIRNKNTSKCSNGSNDGSFQELKWPWLLKSYDRYKDMTFLQNYITDYGEILSRKITKLNNKTHRKLCKEIKRYRNLGLISKTKPILEEGQDSDI